MQTQEVNSAKSCLVEVPEGTVNGGGGHVYLARKGGEQMRVGQGGRDFTHFIKGLNHRLSAT